jgi:hypothetical protein
LIQNGYSVFNVYDGFYSNRNISDLVKNKVREVAGHFKNSLLNFDEFKKLITTDDNTYKDKHKESKNDNNEKKSAA